jgi:hypothetical protein
VRELPAVTLPTGLRVGTYLQTTVPASVSLRLSGEPSFPTGPSTMSALSAVAAPIEANPVQLANATGYNVGDDTPQQSVGRFAFLAAAVFVAYLVVTHVGR